jgi:DNA-binding PadR family transcriptional regulator
MKIAGRTMELLLFLCNTPNKEFSGSNMSKDLGIASGTLYPLLVKLEDAGLVVSRWENGDPQELGRPRRRYYKITGEGAKAIHERMSAINSGFQWAPNAQLAAVLGAK